MLCSPVLNAEFSEPSRLTADAGSLRGLKVPTLRGAPAAVKSGSVERGDDWKDICEVKAAFRSMLALGGFSGNAVLDDVLR